MSYITSVSLPDDLEPDVKDDPEPLSKHVSEWARNYYVRGVPPLEGMDATRLRELLTSARDHHREAATEIEDAIEMIDAAIETAESPRERADGDGVYELEDAKEWWRQQPWDVTLDPDNPAIENWADRLGMETRELCDELSRVERENQLSSLSGGGE